jgi:hypothetical protein
MNGLSDFNQTPDAERGTQVFSRLYHGLIATPDWPALRGKPTGEFPYLEDQMLNFEVQFAASITDVQRHYVMPADSSVIDFLRSHRRIPQLLIEALKPLRQFFDDSILALRATSDENGWEMLYVNILWPGEPHCALEALDKFDDSWWLANSYPAGLNLTFTYKLL